MLLFSRETSNRPCRGSYMLPKKRADMESAPTFSIDTFSKKLQGRASLVRTVGISFAPQSNVKTKPFPAQTAIGRPYIFA